MSSINAENITPPVPPSEATLSLVNPDSLESSPELVRMDVNNFYGDGKFDYVDYSDRVMLSTAWKAISQTELWDFMKEEIESYMWSDDNRIKIIYSKIESLGYGGHSGASFGCTMRNMQYIAQNGEKQFRKLINK